MRSEIESYCSDTTIEIDDGFVSRKGCILFYDFVKLFSLNMIGLKKRLW